MTSPVPAAIEDKKNEIGITGDHHCGASASRMSRNSEPSELWCIVENVTAAMASMMGSAWPFFGLKAHARAEKIASARAAYRKLRESTYTNSVTANATYAPDQRLQIAVARVQPHCSNGTGRNSTRSTVT